MIVAFTGHRPDKLGGYAPSASATFFEAGVKAAIRWEMRALLARVCVEDPRGLTAISGMAQGVDTWAAEVCLELGVPYTAAVPCNGQESPWPEEAQRRYRHLIMQGAEVHVVSPGDYAPWKMQARNVWMVDRCDVLLAVWDGSAGGTANCVNAALRTGRETRRFDPKAPAGGWAVWRKP